MLSIKEVRYCWLVGFIEIHQVGQQLTCITWINIHGLEAIMWRQWRAGPFPDSSQLTVTGESIAVLDDRSRVPVLEPNVATVEVNKYWHCALGRRLDWLTFWGPGLILVNLRVPVRHHITVNALHTVAAFCQT